jgi:hypothetical protein
MKVCALLIEMKKNLVKSLLIALPVLLIGCGGNNSSSSTSSSVFTSDETAEAGNIVKEANAKLIEIKKRFKENEPRLQELQTAMKEKNAEKVRKISDQLVTEINLGTEQGNEAINKIRVAKDMNINSDYKDYLSLKIDSLNKYIEAFEQRRQAATLLRDNYDPKDVAKRERTIVEFKQKEDKFSEIMEEARQSSKDATDLAIETMRRRPQ